MAEDRLYTLLKRCKHKLTKQQYFTIKGQIKSGDIQGAYKGLMKILGVI